MGLAHNHMVYSSCKHMRQELWICCMFRESKLTITKFALDYTTLHTYRAYILEDGIAFGGQAMAVWKSIYPVNPVPTSVTSDKRCNFGGLKEGRNLLILVVHLSWTTLYVKFSVWRPLAACLTATLHSMGGTIYTPAHGSGLHDFWEGYFLPCERVCLVCISQGSINKQDVGSLLISLISSCSASSPATLATSMSWCFRASSFKSPQRLPASTRLLCRSSLTISYGGHHLSSSLPSRKHTKKALKLLIYIYICINFLYIYKQYSTTV